MVSLFWIARGFSVLILAISLAGCASHADLPSYRAVPEFHLTAETGAPFSSGELRGKVWVADFMFTSCPGPCPRMSSQMHQVQTALASTGEVRLVSFTVDPEHDSPAVLAAYAKHFEAQPSIWYFLTGPQSTLNHLSRDVFTLGDVDGSLNHSTRFVLVDRSSKVRGFYLTSEPDSIPQLIRDARRLLKGST